jgi:hypothetical protein
MTAGNRSEPGPSLVSCGGPDMVDPAGAGLPRDCPVSLSDLLSDDSIGAVGAPG